MSVFVVFVELLAVLLTFKSLHRYFRPIIHWNFYLKFEMFLDHSFVYESLCFFVFTFFCVENYVLSTSFLLSTIQSSFRVWIHKGVFSSAFWMICSDVYMRKTALYVHLPLHWNFALKQRGKFCHVHVCLKKENILRCNFEWICFLELLCMWLVYLHGDRKFVDCWLAWTLFIFKPVAWSLIGLLNINMYVCLYVINASNFISQKHCENNSINSICRTLYTGLSVSKKYLNSFPSFFLYFLFILLWFEWKGYVNF